MSIFSKIMKVLSPIESVKTIARVSNPEYIYNSIRKPKATIQKEILNVAGKFVKPPSMVQAAGLAVTQGVIEKIRATLIAKRGYVETEKDVPILKAAGFSEFEIGAYQSTTSSELLKKYDASLQQKYDAVVTATPLITPSYPPMAQPTVATDTTAAASAAPASVWEKAKTWIVGNKLIVIIVGAVVLIFLFFKKRK